jgi:putative DNA-invertase from lambdoid prophage Rac
MKYAAYLRVSTATQVRNDTIEGQREALAAWGKTHDAELTWYEDAGKSGMKSLTGDTFTRMMADLEKLELRGIVVTAYDRLGRDAIGLMQLTRELQAKGKELTSLREGDQRLSTALNASDQLSRDILAVIADFDRKLTMEKLRAGLERHKANGGHTGAYAKIIDFEDKDFKALLRFGAGPVVLARAAVVRDRLTGKIVGRGVNYRTLRSALARWRQENGKEAAAR